MSDSPASPINTTPPKIRFNNAPAIEPNEAQPDSPMEESPTAPIAGISAAGSAKIKTFEKKDNHEERFLREPDKASHGATHVRTFHSKLNNESLAYMDEQINDWLAKHPEAEAKFSTTTIGMYSGKMKEPAIICQVWV